MKNKICASTLLLLIAVAHTIGLTLYIQEHQLSQEPERAEYDGGWEQVNKATKLADLSLLWTIPQEWQGGGEGQTRLLYQDYKKVHGFDYEPREQGDSPSCVGQAAAAAVDFLAAVEIVNGDREVAPPAKFSASVIYGLSRQEIGGLGPSKSGGSHCLWAAQALQRFGVVPKQNFPLIGVDLSQYTAKQAEYFGNYGVPVSLEALSRLHPVRDYINVDTYDEIRDSIYYGCPVIIGSSQGFGAKNGANRDADGFLNPPKRLFFPSVWRHAMVAIGVSDQGRKGVLILNSWGSDWVQGPKRFGDEPEGSFWVDARIIESMARYGDSYALRNFKGYKPVIWR